MGHKVKVRWTIEVTESYETVLDFEDFASLFDSDTPEDLAELEAELQAGELDKSDINAEELAGLEEADNMEFVGVNDRYVDSFELVKGEENG